MCHSMSRGSAGSQLARRVANRPAKAQGHAAGAIAAEACGGVQRFGMGLQMLRENESRRADDGGPIHVRLAHR